MPSLSSNPFHSPFRVLALAACGAALLMAPGAVAFRLANRPVVKAFARIGVESDRHFLRALTPADSHYASQTEMNELTAALVDTPAGAGAQLLPLRIPLAAAVAREKLKFDNRLMGTRLENSADGRFIIKGADCEKVRAAGSALAGLGRGPEPTGPRGLSCACTGKDCVAEVTTLLPERARAIYGNFDDYANCFGTALYLGGLTEGPVTASSRELHAAVAEKCAPVPFADLRAGDLVVVYRFPDLQALETPKEAEHAFVFVAPEIAFHKPSYGSDQPVQFIALDRLRKVYGLDSSLAVVDAAEELRLRRTERDRQRTTGTSSGKAYTRAFRCAP